MTRFDPMEAELEWDRLAGLEADRLEGHAPCGAVGVGHGRRLAPLDKAECQTAGALRGVQGPSVRLPPGRVTRK